MKIIRTLIIGSLLFNSIDIFAQSQKYLVGFEGGPSLIILWGNEGLKDYHKNTIGYSGGVFLQHNLTEKVSLRTTLSFERKGSQTVFDNPTTVLKLDYLTLPILARIHFGKKKNYFFDAGPFIGYLLKETEVTTGDNVAKITSDNTSYFSKFDAGVSIGLGFAYPIKGNIIFSVEIRNNLGIYNIHLSSISYKDAPVRTNSTNLLLGMAYRIENN